MEQVQDRDIFRRSDLGKRIEKLLWVGCKAPISCYNYESQVLEDSHNTICSATSCVGINKSNHKALPLANKYLRKKLKSFL